MSIIYHSKIGLSLKQLAFKPPTHKKPFALIAVVMVTLLICSCQRYSVSLNDRVVYTPPTLLSDYTIQDEALRACVDAMIQESSIDSAEQLDRLACPEGKIANLKGIEAFTKLKVLGLAGNIIQDISILGSLPALEQIDVSHNNILDFGVLKSLSVLRSAKLDGNKDAQCESLNTFASSIKITRPKHCSDN
ncbi:MAG: leucine-rich repeat domain-containing protein [Agarilytica sp.]